MNGAASPEVKRVCVCVLCTCAAGGSLVAAGSEAVEEALDADELTDTLALLSGAACRAGNIKR